MEETIDFTQRSEPELVEMFGRLDPRYAPEQCKRLAAYLTAHGYLVTEGQTGPGSAEASPGKLQTLIGAPRPFACAVNFGMPAKMLMGGFLTISDDLGLQGAGTLQFDGIYLRLWSSNAEEVELSARHIRNVESLGNLVRFEYGGGEYEAGAMTLRVQDAKSVERLLAVLPKRTTPDARAQLQADADFERKVSRSSALQPVTLALIAINALVFVASVAVGGAGELFDPAGTLQVAWGSNFGPDTSGGQWWRLFTSMFIHFGLVHVAGNMVALAIFGSVVERLLGAAKYLLIFVLAGMGASLASIAWSPQVNSAGASGAIYGLVGALLAMSLRGGRTLPVDVARSINHWVLIYLLATVSAGLRYKGIDNAAHVGGLVSGFILGLATTAGSLAGGPAASGRSPFSKRRPSA